MSEPEELLAFQLKAVGVPFEREVQFAKPRKWRADFVLPRWVDGCCHIQPNGKFCGADERHGLHHGAVFSGSVGTSLNHEFDPGKTGALLIEIDGGTWSGGRHVTGRGHASDSEKRNAAVLLGYRPLTFTPAQIEDGSALIVIEKALGKP